MTGSPTSTGLAAGLVESTITNILLLMPKQSSADRSDRTSPAGAFTGRLLWVGCGSATEALTLFNLYPEGGQATLVEVQPDLARHLGGALAGKVPKCQTC